MKTKDEMEIKIGIDDSEVDSGVKNIKKSLEGLSSTAKKVKSMFNFGGGVFSGLLASLRNVVSRFALLRATVSKTVNEIKAKLGKPIKMAFGHTSLGKDLNKAKDAIDRIGAVGKHVKNVLGKIFFPVSMGAKAFENILSKITRGLGRVAVYRAFRMILNWIAKAFKEGVTNAYNWAKATGNSLAGAIDQLRVEANYLKNTFGALASPLIQAVTPALTAVIEKIVAFANAVNQVMSSLFGKSTWTKALKVPVTAGNQVASGAGKATKAIKEWKKQLLGFDEINNLTDNKTPNGGGTGGGGGAASSGSYAFTEDDIDADKQALAKKLKEAWAKGDFTSIGKMVANKINKALQGINWSKIRKTTRKIATSIATFINGFVGKLNWKLLGKTVSEAIATAMDFVSTFLETVNWQQIGKAIVQFFVGIDWGKLFKGATRLIGNIAGAIAGVIAGALSEIGSNIKKYFADSIDEAGGNIVLGLLNGILKGLGNIGKWIVDNIFKPFIDGIKSAFGISSPAKQMEEPGKNIIAGLFKGIKDKFVSVLTWVKGIPKKIIGAIKKIPKLTLSIGAKLKDKAKDLWNTFKKAWGNAKDKVVGIGAAIKDKASELWENFKKGWNNLKGRTVEIFAKIGSTIKKLWDGFVSLWNKDKGTESSPNFAVGFYLKILSKVKDLWNGFVKLWKGENPTLETEVKIGSKGGKVYSNWVNSEWTPKTKDKHLSTHTKITSPVGGDNGVFTQWKKNSWDKKDRKVGTKTHITSNASNVFNNWKKGLKGKYLTMTVVKSVFNAAQKGLTALVNALFGGKPSFSLRAEGGFVDKGEMFIAREAGAEMVGRIGSRTAVANNAQIVEAIKMGVYDALVSAGGQDTNVNVYLQGDTRQLFKVVRDEGRRYSAETGQYAWG